MSLNSALSIATGSLANINSQLALVSQNVANASTPGYAAEIATQQSVTAGGEGLGVRTGLTIRNVDTTLQSELLSQNATVAGLQTQQTALQAIDAAQGTPGQGTDIASLLGNLQDQFSTLLNDPSSAPQQSQVVSAANSLAQGINALSDTYTTQRQTAEDNLVSEVATLNSTLGTIGSLSNQIVTLQASGQQHGRSRESARRRRCQSLAIGRREGAAAAEWRSAGRLYRRRGPADPRQQQPVLHHRRECAAWLHLSSGSIGGIMLGGTDVTSQLQGGQIGANITLRDSTLPTDQAELDEFAQNLASRFDTRRAQAVHRSIRERARDIRTTFAGAEQLCRVRRHHSGQCRSAGNAIAGARRHTRHHQPGSPATPASFRTC